MIDCVQGMIQLQRTVLEGGIVLKAPATCDGLCARHVVMVMDCVWKECGDSDGLCGRNAVIVMDCVQSMW